MKKAKSRSKRMVENSLGSRGWDIYELRALFNPVDPWSFFPERINNRVERLKAAGFQKSDDPIGVFSFNCGRHESTWDVYYISKTFRVISVLQDNKTTLIGRRWNCQMVEILLQTKAPRWQHASLEGYCENGEKFRDYDHDWFDLDLTNSICKEYFPSPELRKYKVLGWTSDIILSEETEKYVKSRTNNDSSFEEARRSAVEFDFE